jgi:hypothetical protein
VPEHEEEAAAVGQHVAALDAFTDKAVAEVLTATAKARGEKQGGKEVSGSAGFKVGDRVEAVFDGPQSDTGEWFGGEIVKVHEKVGMGAVVSFLYDVQYDDGDQDVNMEAQYIRRPESTAAAAAGGGGTAAATAGGGGEKAKEEVEDKKGKTASGADSEGFTVGDRVEAVFDGPHSDTGEWFGGKVVKVHERMGMGAVVSFLYDVQYDDGDQDVNMEAQYIRRLESTAGDGGEGREDEEDEEDEEARRAREYMEEDGEEDGEGGGEKEKGGEDGDYDDLYAEEGEEEDEEEETNAEYWGGRKSIGGGVGKGVGKGGDGDGGGHGGGDDGGGGDTAVLEQQRAELLHEAEVAFTPFLEENGVEWTDVGPVLQELAFKGGVRKGVQELQKAIAAPEDWFMSVLGEEEGAGEEEEEGNEGWREEGEMWREQQRKEAEEAAAAEAAAAALADANDDGTAAEARARERLMRYYTSTSGSSSSRGSRRGSMGSRRSSIGGDMEGGSGEGDDAEGMTPAMVRSEVEAILLEYG